MLRSLTYTSWYHSPACLPSKYESHVPLELPGGPNLTPCLQRPSRPPTEINEQPCTEAYTMRLVIEAGRASQNIGFP
jgi:hypothetical protein